MLILFRNLAEVKMNLNAKYSKYGPHLEDIVFYLKNKLSVAMAEKVLCYVKIKWKYYNLIINNVYLETKWSHTFARTTLDVKRLYGKSSV